MRFHPFAQFPTWGFRGFDSEVFVSQRSWFRYGYWALSALIKLHITVYIDKSRFCSIDSATRLWIERPDFDSQRGQDFSLLNNVNIGRSVIHTRTFSYTSVCLSVSLSYVHIFAQILTHLFRSLRYFGISAASSGISLLPHGYHISGIYDKKFGRKNMNWLLVVCSS
jgi:hypothetical protein